jgi:predicted DNA-binding ribbon-helix-helix protein
VHLEDAFWHALREIAVAKDTTRQPPLVEQVSQTAIRVFVLAYDQGVGR